jgi:hypothetical protein
MSAGEEQCAARPGSASVTSSDRGGSPSALRLANMLPVTAALFLIGASFFSYISLYVTYPLNQLGFSQSEVGPSRGRYGLGALGAVAAIGLGSFDPSGSFAGYPFGRLVVVFGWGAASVAGVAMPAPIATVLMSLFDMPKVRAS